MSQNTVRCRRWFWVPLFVWVVAGIEIASSSPGESPEWPLRSPIRHPKIASRLLETMERRPEEPHKVWVYFTDKGIGTDAEYRRAVGDCLAQFNPKALKRRAKVRPENDLVDFRDLPVSKKYIQEVLGTGVKHRATSKWLNAVSVEAAALEINEIEILPFVRAIDPVIGFKRETRIEPPTPEGKIQRRSPHGLNYGPSFGQLLQISVPPLHDLGYSGAGVTVLMLDTGFNRKHESLQGINLIVERDFINDDDTTQNQPGDPSGQHDHGTLTLSTLGGFKEGQLIGPAYGASFLLAKTEDISSETPIEEDYWMEGIEWGDSLGADVASSSLGYIDWYVYADMNGDSAVTTRAADMAAQNGIVVCNAAGNERQSPWGAIIAPADADSILAVGAVDNTGQIAFFSSPGPTFDGRTKPEVCAQGFSTYCADPDNVTGYVAASGTSLSTPLIGGVAALLLEVHPTWTPMEVRKALLQTASQASTPDNDYGWGIANAIAASGLEPPPPTLFKRGDANASGTYTIGDALYILVDLFGGGPSPICFKAGDANDGGTYTIGDALYILVDLFGGGPPPPPPFSTCGADSTADVLNCASFPPCS